MAARLGVGGLGHAIGEGLAAEFEESLGFRAIVGCRWAVGPEDFAGELDFDRLSSSPAGQMEFPGTLLRFGESDCVGEFGSGIRGEGFPVDTQDDITGAENPIGTGVRLDLGDENLASVFGDQSVGMDPAAQAGGSEVPVLSGIIGKLIASGKIGACIG